MSRRTMLVGSRSLVVALDDPPPVAERWSALAFGRAIDEQTGQPAQTPMQGRTDRTGVTVTASGDGSFCLVARPWLACPPLLAPSYDVTVSLEADRYLPMRITAAIPSHQRQIVSPAPLLGSPLLALNTVANLVPGQLLAIGPPADEERARIRHLGPGAQQVTLEGGLGRPHAIGDAVVADAWTPVDLGTVALRRPPIVVRGRTVRRDPATNTVTPVPSATVTLADFWTTLAAVRALLPGSMTDPNPLTRAFLVVVSPGLVAPRDVGSGFLARQDLAPVAAGDRFLVDAAAPGATTIRVSDRQALVAGSILRIDPEDSEVSEAVTVVDVTGFGPPDQPGDVTLALPLRAPHRRGAHVVRRVPQPAMAAVALRRDARPGDRAVFVSSLALLPDHVDVRLTGGPAPTERQHLSHFETTSDLDGYFTLPPVHRVAALQLHCTAAALAAVDSTIHPEVQPDRELARRRVRLATRREKSDARIPCSGCVR